MNVRYFEYVFGFKVTERYTHQINLVFGKSFFWTPSKGVKFLYETGYESLLIETLAIPVNNALKPIGFEMTPRQSDFSGDYYDWAIEGISGKGLKLTHNYNTLEELEEDRWSEREFKKYPLLLYVNITQDANCGEMIAKTLKQAFGAEIILLRQEEYSDSDI
jgi:hypothetical protein